MKIWIFNHYAILPNSSGGTRHFDLSRELVNHNHEVTIFASSFEHQTREDNHITDSRKVLYEKYDNVSFCWIKTSPYFNNNIKRIINILIYSVRLYIEASRRNDRPDIIIGSLMHPLAAYVGHLISRKKKCKFIFEERDLWPQTLVDLGKIPKWNPIVWVLYKLEYFLYKKADKIILLFEKAIKYVENKGIERSKIILIPNGVDLKRFEQDVDLPDDMQHSINELKEKYLAVYIGSHGLSNNLDALLDAAEFLNKKNSRIHFLFVGNGPEKAGLVKRAEKKQISNVSFFPPINKEMIPTLLKQMNCGLVSMKNSEIYKWGTSLNKYYDYMAASLPIVMLSTKPEELLENSNCGLRADSVDQLIQILEQLSCDSEYSKRLGSNGRMYVESHHSWEQLANKFLKELEYPISK